MGAEASIKIVTVNKKARFNYEIEDAFEAGLVLKGSEVKSIRDGNVNIGDAFCLIRGGEAFVHNMTVQPYNHATHENHEPEAVRKLLLHGWEIHRIHGKVLQKGYSIVPLKLYFKRGRIKLEVALARGKKSHDKREAIKEREAKREMGRIERQYNLR